MHFTPGRGERACAWKNEPRQSLIELGKTKFSPSFVFFFLGTWSGDLNACNASPPRRRQIFGRNCSRSDLSRDRPLVISFPSQSNVAILLSGGCSWHIFPMKHASRSIPNRDRKRSSSRPEAPTKGFDWEVSSLPGDWPMIAILYGALVILGWRLGTVVILVLFWEKLFHSI